jgi:hypothetical protein
LRRFIFAVVLICLVSFSFQTEAAEGRNSVSVAGGGAWPEGMDATWYITAAARWHLDDNWAIEPDFGYWKQDEAEVVHLQRGDLIYSLRDIHAGGNLLFIGSWGDVGLYTGGGAAAHWRSREISQNVTPPNVNPDADTTRLGLQILFGVDIPISDGIDVTAAVRDDFIFRDDDLDTQVVFKAYAGLRFYID